MTESRQSAATCPLCGGDNQCAVAAGQPPETCWCQRVTLSATALASAANTARERCLCPACGLPVGETPNEG